MLHIVVAISGFFVVVADGTLCLSAQKRFINEFDYVVHTTHTHQIRLEMANFHYTKICVQHKPKPNWIF